MSALYLTTTPLISITSSPHYSNNNPNPNFNAFLFSSNNNNPKLRPTLSSTTLLCCGHVNRVDNGLGYFDSDQQESGTLVRTQVQTIADGSGSTRPSEYDPAPDVDYLQELLAIQQQGPRTIGFFGTRNMGFMHQELIEILSYAMVITVKNVIEKPHNDHLPLLAASRLRNMDIISHVQQVICFAFRDSRLLMETCQEAKNMRKIVTLFYLD